MRIVKLGKHPSGETLKKMSENNRCENHPGVKLTKKKVLKIRRLRYFKKITQKKLAEMFGVSRGCIVHILCGETWNPNNLSTKELLYKI